MKKRGGRICRLILFPLVAGLAFLCVWRITVLPEGASVRILGWSLAGLLLAAILGWHTGRVTASRLERIWVFLLSTISLGALLLLLPVYILSYRLEGPPWVFLLEGTAVVLLVASVFAAGYLLGRLLMPGRSRLPRYQRIGLMLIVYGCLLIGFRLGYSRHGYRIPLPRPLAERQLPPEVPYEEALEVSLGGFPPEFTENANEEGEISYELVAEEKKEGEEEEEPASRIRYVLGCYGPHPEDTVDAEEGRALIDGQVLELVDYHLRLSENSTQLLEEQNDEGRRLLEKHESPVRIEGPVPGAPGREYLYCGFAEWAGGVWVDAYDLELVFRWPEALDILTARIEPVLVPSGVWVPCHRFPESTVGRGPDGERLLVVRTGYGSLIPGPLELRLDVWHGDARSYTLPAREGEVLRTEHDAVVLVKVHPGKFTSEHLDSGRYSLVPAAEKEPAATAVFWSLAVPGAAGICGVEAVGKNGEIYPGEYEWPHSGFGSVVFGCRPEEIGGFRFFEKTGFTRLRYRIPRLEELPRENAGCRNLLDLRVPEILVRPPCSPSRIISLCLMGSAFLDVSSELSVYQPFQGAPPANPTFRDVLNHSLGDSWDAGKGILTHGGRGPVRWKGGPFIRKILNAKRALRE